MEPHAGRDAEQTGGAKSGNEKVEKKTAAAAQSDGGQGKEKDKKRARAASPDSEVEYVEEKPKAPDIIKISDSESDYSGSEEDERGPQPACHLLLYTTIYVSSYYYTTICVLILLTKYLYTRQANPQIPIGTTSEPVRGERQK